jgi:predicted phosphodiesterase
MPVANLTKKVLVIPDTHVPFQDERAFQLMLKVGVDYAPDEVVVLGDFADFYWASFHGKHPEIVLNHSPAEEIRQVNQKLDEMRQLFPSAKLVFIEGNHEYRLARYMVKNAPDLYDSVSLKTILSLDSWEVIPYGPSQLYQIADSKLYARHQPYGGGMHCAYQSLVKGGKSLLFGHVHRIQEYQSVDAVGANHRAVGLGWLGNKDHPVMQYVQNHHQWALGFGLVDVLPSGNFFQRTVHIIDYKCMADGWLYEG